MATFTLDKDNLVSPTIPQATTPMQITILREGSWTPNHTRVVVLEENDSSVFKETMLAFVERNTYPINVKPKNYKLQLDQYKDGDVVNIIVS